MALPLLFLLLNNIASYHLAAVNIRVERRKQSQPIAAISFLVTNMLAWCSTLVGNLLIKLKVFSINNFFILRECKNNVCFTSFQTKITTSKKVLSSGVVEF